MGSTLEATLRTLRRRVLQEQIAEEKAPIASLRPPFQLRGSSFTSTVLRVSLPLAYSFETLLAAKLTEAPGFFKGAPVVLEFEDEKGEGILVSDLASLMSCLKTLSLIVVGVRGDVRGLSEAAVAVGLAVFSTVRSEGARSEEKRARAIPLSASPMSTMMVSEPVRSGQRIVHMGGDVVITTAVSSGAEVIAGGHIHVYGPLRGRAIAGAEGYSDARIFCTNLDAELVAINGVYVVSEYIDAALRYQRVSIAATGNGLTFERLS